MATAKERLEELRALKAQQQATETPRQRLERLRALKSQQASDVPPATGEAPVSPAAMEARQAPEPSFVDRLNKEILDAPGGTALAEFGAAINRGAVNLADFFTTKPVRAAQQLAGVPEEERISTLAETDLGQSATVGDYMEPGLARDIVQTSGELVAPGAVGGAAFRTAAQAIPKVQAGAQTIGQRLTQQMGGSTARQDVKAALLSGGGSVVGRESGIPGGEQIGAITAPLAPQAIKSTLQNAVKLFFRGTDKNIPGMTKVIDDFAAVGESPTVAQATGRRSLQGAENLSGKVIGGGRIGKKAESLATSIQNRVRNIADETSPVVGSEQAGVTIKRGITGKGGFVDRFKAKSSSMWNKSDSFVPDTADAPIQNTKATLNSLVRGGKVGEVLDNPQLTKIRQIFEDIDSVDYRTLRDLRTSIGQKLGNNELISDVPRAELKRLYGAITQDIKQVAAQQGDEALRAFNRANKFTSSGHQRLGDFVERISKKVEVDKIFDAVTRGGEGTRVINSFKRSLKPEEWEVVASNVVRRLGKSTAGQQNAAGDNFSVNKFLTDWNRLGPAKNALFSGSKKLDALKRDLEKIARVAEVSKESAKAAANPSGTGQSIQNFGLAAGTVGGAASLSPTVLGTVAGTVTMNNMGARLMTNKRFVNWLVKNMKAPAELTASQISSLVNIAKQSELEDAIAIQSLIEELSTQEAVQDGK